MTRTTSHRTLIKHLSVCQNSLYPYGADGIYYTTVRLCAWGDLNGVDELKFFRIQNFTDLSAPPVQTDPPPWPSLCGQSAAKIVCSLKVWRKKKLIKLFLTRVFSFFFPGGKSREDELFKWEVVFSAILPEPCLALIKLKKIFSQMSKQTLHDDAFNIKLFWIRENLPWFKIVKKLLTCRIHSMWFTVFRKKNWNSQKWIMHQREKRGGTALKFYQPCRPAFYGAAQHGANHHAICQISLFSQRAPVFFKSKKAT